MLLVMVIVVIVVISMSSGLSDHASAPRRRRVRDPPREVCLVSIISSSVKYKS
jgi:hypothetical protein